MRILVHRSEIHTEYQYPVRVKKWNSQPSSEATMTLRK